MRHDPADDGFLHRGQIIYAIQYHLTDGSSLIVWLNRAGNDANGRTLHCDKRRAIVTARAGDVILYGGERRTVATVKVWRSLENMHGLPLLQAETPSADELLQPLPPDAWQPSA